MSSTDPLVWARIEPILDGALDLPVHQRAQYLAQACGDDPSLRARVEQMLAAGEDPDGPLERPLESVVGPLLAAVDESSPGAVSPGDMVGPWRLVTEIGRGGMGEVYRAERADGQFAQTAALKLVRRGREHDPLLIRRFLEERRILATLAHPHIGRLLDGGVTPTGLPWFAMEYIPGRPLDSYCEDRHLDTSARLGLVEQVLEAVAYAHRNLLVHRDLKPSNIFVTDDGEVKLLDFGIAKLLGEENLSDPELTLAYGRVMTPEYAAPEQVLGGTVTTATDIYSLGAVLYQLLTGRRAHRFEKRTAAEIERIVCETDPEAPSIAMRSAATAAGRRTERWVRGLSADLDTIVLTALQKDPARRYASAEAMLEDIRRLRTGRPLLARPDSIGYRWTKFIGRHRIGVSAGAVAALAIVAGVAATAWQARAARQEMARADRVKEFLVDLLHQADPNVTQGKEFTVRELLDRGTHRVDSMLGREPRVQAELYELIGNTYAHLGLADQADTLHRKGLAVIRALYGPGDPEVLDQEMAVAWGLNDRGRYRDADSLLTRALASYQAAGGPESQALSDAIDILGTAKKRLDQQAAAESLYRRSLAMQIRLTGASDTITASRLSDLGVLLGGQNRLVPAESALVAAQAHRRGVLDPLDVRYLVGEASLASVMMKRGDLAGAEPRLTTALAGLRQVEKNGDLNLARTLDRMALLQFLQMHVAATIRTGEMAHDMFVTRMGDDHPETLNNLSALAWYRSASGDSNVRKAANLAYEGLRLKLGDRHDWTLLAGQRLCAILLRAGQFAQARSIDDVTLATVRDKYEHLPPAFAGLIATQAQLLEIRGDSSAADTSFREALGSLTGGTRVDSAAYPGILTQYAELLAARGNLQAAGSMLRQALAFFPAGGDSSEVTSVEARRELALVISSATSHPQSRIEPTKAGGPSKPARVPTGVRGN